VDERLIKVEAIMKKIISLVLVAMLSMTAVFAENIQVDPNLVEASVKINDHYLTADTEHILQGDTVFVVARYLVEALEGSIEWVNETQTVIIRFGEEKTIEMVIGSDQALVNGESVAMHKAPFLKDGRTMIPVRFVSETFDCTVGWIHETYTVDIQKEGLEIAEAYRLERSYTDEDLRLLAKIVTVESGDASFEMALAIANTVLNRVKDSRFPNTVSEVIYQVDVYKQFPPAHKDSFKTLEPSEMSIKVSKRALEGINNIGYSLFFNNQPFKSKSKDDLIRIIDGEYFYK